MRSANPTAPSRALSIMAEVGGAIFGGVIMALVFGYVISLMLANAGLGMGLLTAQAYAGIVGFGVGAGVGAAIAGRVLGQSGSLWLAIIVAVVGGALVAFVMRVFTLGDPIVTLGVAVLLMVVFAVVGYNLRRGA